MSMPFDHALQEETAAARILEQDARVRPRFLQRLQRSASSSLVLALVSPFSALASPSITRVLLAVALLDLPFQFGTHVFYRDEDAVAGTLSGYSISSMTIALTALYLSWFLSSLAGRNRRQHAPLDINLPLVFFLAFNLLSVFVASNSTFALYEFFLVLQYYGIYFYVANKMRERQDVLFVASFLLIGCLIESAAMVVLKFTGMPETIWGIPTHIHLQMERGNEAFRIGGTIGSPNEAAAYLSLLLPLAAAFLFVGVKRSYKWLALGVLGLGSIALIFTYSRGGWLALLIGGSIGLFALLRTRRMSLKAPLAVLALLLLLFLPFYSNISARLFGDDEGSAESRIPLIGLAFRMIADNPVLGVGSNNFSVAMERYLTPEFRKGFLYAVHNKYLLTWAETGIGGLLAYLAFLFGSLRTGWKCWRLQSDRFFSILALGMTGAIAGHMVHMNVDLFRIGPVQELVWLFAALLVAIYRLSAPVPSAEPVKQCA